MSTLDIFIDFMWPVMISLILSSDNFDCNGESPWTTKVGYISLRYGAFICDVYSTCISQRGIRREFQTWPKFTNGRRLKQSRCMILKVSMWLFLPESTNGQCLNKAAVWFWRCPCDVVAVKSHNDFEEAARTLTFIKDGCFRFVPCLVRQKWSGHRVLWLCGTI